jgi:hypothetical protein
MDEWLVRTRLGLIYPVEASRFVERSIEQRSGRLINEFTWGGYLAWRFAGRYQVFVDGRTQLYDEAFWRATYLGSPSDAKPLFDRANADAAIVPVEGSRFDAPLRAMGWSEVYRDAVAVVLTPPAAATATAE